MCCLFKDVLFVGLGDCGDGPPLVALGTEVARGEVPRTQMVALGLASAVQSTPEFGLLAEPVSTAHASSTTGQRLRAGGPRHFRPVGARYHAPTAMRASVAPGQVGLLHCSGLSCTIENHIVHTGFPESRTSFSKTWTRFGNARRAAGMIWNRLGPR